MTAKEAVELSDQELVQSSLSTPDNFRHLIKRYQDKLSRYVERTLFVNHEDTEDILQEVFIKVYRNLNSYNPDFKFSSWIYRITYNQCVSFLRSNIKYKQNLDTDLEKPFIKELIADCDLEAEVLQEEQVDFVRAALMRLDGKYRNVLVLKFMEEKDYNEISEILKIPSGTVGSLISRAKTKFRQSFGHGRVK